MLEFDQPMPGICPVCKSRQRLKINPDCYLDTHYEPFIETELSSYRLVQHCVVLPNGMKLLNHPCTGSGQVPLAFIDPTAETGAN